MASAPNWIPSKRLRAAARAERTRIEREIEKISRQQDRLRQNLESLNETRTHLEEELASISRFADEDGADDERGRLRIVESNGSDAQNLTLKGAQIREFAVRLVADTEQGEQGIHYRTWYELVTNQGVRLAGKDPLATFLTQISRSPVVEKTDHPGVYRVDPTFPDRAILRVEALEELVESLKNAEAGASIDEIEVKRAKEREVRAELRALRRDLDEAVTSLR